MERAAAISFVNEYLRLVAERRFDRAAECLAPGARLVFPPNVTLESNEQVAEWDKDRCRWVDKVRDRWDVLTTPSGRTVVYSLGTLFGENNQGARFEGIRYLDRFEIEDGKIVLQEVWNDLAESGVLQQPAAAQPAAPAGR